MSRYKKGNLGSGCVAIRSSERGSAMLELAVIFAIVMVLIFIPMTTQVLPRYQKGNVTINLYESYNAYTVPENHFTNLNPEGILVAADLGLVATGLQAVANDLAQLTKQTDFCGILLKNAQGNNGRTTTLEANQGDVNPNCAPSINSVPPEIISDFEAQVIPDDGVAFGATVFHIDPTDNSLTYAHLRLSPGVINP